MPTLQQSLTNLTSKALNTFTPTLEVPKPDGKPTFVPQVTEKQAYNRQPDYNGKKSVTG